ncbi:MAG: lysylphosphatidylglycerol synthase transmembrane domain-containing protein [Anaerolineales bacterium]|jgi:hypothetical protein
MNSPARAPERKISAGKAIRWAGTIIALGLMVWLLSRQGWGEIWEDIQQIGLPRFLLAIGLLFGSRFMISLRWYALLRGAGEKVSYLSSLKITYAGLFSNNFLPSTIGGDVVRLAGAMQAGWDGAVVAASLVIDRLVGMTGMATFFPFALPTILQYYKTAVLRPKAGLALGMTAAVPSKLQKGWQKVKQIFRRIWDWTLLWVRQPKSLVLPFIATFGHMLFTFGMVSVILSGLDENLTFFQIGGLWVVVYFITLIPISIAGLGVQELVIVFAYHTMGGVTEAHSLTLALLFRTLMMLSSLPGAVFVPGMLNKKKQPPTPSSS